MRNLPVDVSRLTLIGTGKAAAKPEYARLSDGTSTKTGQQAKDKLSGLPLWIVDVLVDDPDSDRADTVSVTVASADEPSPPRFQPVVFDGLTASAYVPNGSRWPEFRFAATGIQAGKPVAPPSTKAA